MGIEDIEIPEVPIPVRILAEKRAAARRAQRAQAKKQNSRTAEKYAVQQASPLRKPANF